MSQIPSATVIPASSSPAATSAPVQPSTSSTTSTSSSSSVTSTSTTSTTSTTSSSSSVDSSSSSSVLSSSTSTTSSTTASSSTTTSSTTSSRSRESSSSSLSFIVETSNGQVFTRTSIVTVPISSPTASSNTRSSVGFFHQKGAVAGVFSVVGVIGLVALFFLFTSFIRRRRARKLDREIDEAAAAAAAAAAQVPDFDDFDYTSGTGAGYGHYSETSHGTYNQPPLSPHETHNNLGDIPASYEPYGIAGQAAGAAGIGARGRSQRGGGAQDPFGALAANPPEQYEMYERRQSWTQGIPRGGPGVAPYDLIQAAGLNDGDPYAVARATSQRLHHSQSKSGVSGPTGSQSYGTSILPPSTESYPMPTPAPGYPDSQDTPYPAEKARYSASYAPAGGVSTMPPDVNEEAYSGYQDQPSAFLDNPHSPGFVGPGVQDEQQEVAGEYDDPHQNGDSARASLADDEDYGYNSGHRVLRVANE